MTNTRNGINVSRRIGAGGGSAIGEELRRVRLQGSPPLFQVAVVVDVIYDPLSLTTEQVDAIANTVTNPALAATMPRNSILARVISNSHDLGDPTPRILYPFFSSHFALPVKPGEQIFVLYPDPHTDGNEIGYWLTRVPEAATIEDVNFTHGDRRYDSTLNPDNQSTSQRGQASSGDPPLPGFPNGGGTPESISLFVSGGNDRPYEIIATGSFASKQATVEAVPRFTKRPGDFLIQGSNNARIVLGEDRTGPATRPESPKNDKVGQAGTIDLVAGVGGIRNFPTGRTDDPLSTNASKRPTAPHVTDNARRKKEVDKTPFLRRKRDNVKEGDPDFKRDLSRVYVSMKTAGDKNFDVKKNKLVADGKLITNITDLPDGDTDGQPFVIAKSEHVRIIAQGKDTENGPQDSGDIRIIKEGKESDKDLGVILMNKEGEIIAVGKNIQLLTHDDGKLFLQTKTGSPQAGEGEPYIKYSEFVKVVEGLQNQINTLESFIKQTVLQTVIGGALNASICTPFSPDPACQAAAQLATNLAPNLTTQLQSDKTNVSQAKDNAKSTKIYGK